MTLEYFRATGIHQAVLVEWKTATELDNAGFFLSRSLVENGPFERINHFFMAEGDDLLGGTYGYTDVLVTNGIRYYYILEALSNDNSSESFGPVSAVAGNSATTVVPTSMPTGTITPPTPTHTLPPGVTPSLTVTPSTTGTPSTSTPTQTSTPGMQTPTVTPSVTAAVSPTGQAQSTGTAPASQPTPGPTSTGTPYTSTPTETLIPLPSIAVVFPPTPTSQHVSEISRLPLSPELYKQGGATRRIGLAQIIPFALLILTWIALGAWFIYSSRHWGG